jgi:hypothetical protein
VLLKPRLSGCVRLGIVATVLWVLAASAYLAYTVNRDAEADSHALYDACVGAAIELHLPHNHCSDLWGETYITPRVQGELQRLPPRVLFPAMAAWVVAWLGFVTFRWVKKGLGSCAMVSLPLFSECAI